MASRFVIIGAGMAGAACAYELTRCGHQVIVVEKDKDVGGRMGTCQLPDSSNGEISAFDYGAQYFTARDAGFQQWIRDAGVVAWEPVIIDYPGDVKRSTASDPWFIGSPSMRNTIEPLLARANVMTSTEITRIDATARHTFTLVTDRGERLDDEFDAVVIAAPAAQAAALAAPYAPRLAAYARAATFSPCWAAMIVTRAASGPSMPDVIVPAKNTPLGWLARNSSKPGRAQSETLDAWVAHAGAEWSTQHLEDSADNVSRLLSIAFIDEMRRTADVSVRIERVETHLWRQAKAARAPEGTPSAALENGVALCGDYMIGGRVEAAYLSGIEAARLLLAR